MDFIDNIFGNIPTVSPVENLAHLHVHTTYSMLDGACKIPDLVARAKELQMTALAITDHNHLGGSIVFQNECRKQGIKPLLGYEGYFTYNVDIASLPVEDRNRMALFNALQAGETLAGFEEGINVIELQSFEETKELFSDKEVSKLKKDNKEILEKYAYDMHQYHILYIAQNQTGWNNLVKLQSESADRCTYNGRFLADLSMVAKYSEGVICTTACIGSLTSKLIQNGQEERSFFLAKKLHEIFGDRFYFEIQPLAIPQQAVTNLKYMEWSKELGIKSIATSDVHYVNKGDWDDHDTYLCISTKKYKDQTDRMKYSNDFWLRSADEMVQAFDDQIMTTIADGTRPQEFLDQYKSYCIEAIKETNNVAASVSDDITIGSKTPLYPHIEIPAGMTADDVLRIKAYLGLHKYKEKREQLGDPINIDEYEDRLFDELEVITAKQYSNYFLMVEEYVIWGNSTNPETGLPNCVVGPGRGSADGSLVLFCIEVSLIDPILHNLMFSRFLNMDRMACPDIDCDFDYDNRPLLIKHLEEKYGRPKVAHIGAWISVSILTGIKDFGRVLRADFVEMNHLTKELQKLVTIPQAKFKHYDALEESDPEAFKKFKELEEKYSEIFRLARKFEGACRQYGTHASGVLVTPVDVTDVFPTRKDTESGVTITLYTGVEIEDVGGIKFDILGLKTLTVIKNTLRHIKHPEDSSRTMNFNDLYKLADITDSNVYEMIASARTDGVFQIESNMYKGLVENIKPTNIEDISAILAIGRPGPLGAGCDKMYAAWKYDPSQIKQYLHGIEDILEESYGTIIYQEQFMKICMRVAGFDLGQSDSLARKIIAKKKHDMVEMLRRIFVYGKKNTEGPEGWKDDPNAPWYDDHYGPEIKGGVNNGYTATELNVFFETVKDFASYSFNKAHSAAYGYISFLTAWLKYYYPAKYMAALLSMQEKDEKKEHYISVCSNKLGIKVTVPDVNNSEENFVALDDNTILYGIGSIKGIGGAKIDALMKNRPYASIEDAMAKIEKKFFNKTVGENLIKAGAFDTLEGMNRFITLNKFHTIRKDKGVEVLDENTFTREACLELEMDTLGSCVSYKPLWASVKAGATFMEPCTIVSVKEHTAATSKKQMAFLQVQYDASNVRAVVFPKLYASCKPLLKAGQKVFISGKKDEKDEMIINKISLTAEGKAAAPKATAPVFDMPVFDMESLLVVA